MNKEMKAALVIGAAILLAVAMWIYFSPFQSCVRAYKANTDPGTVGATPGYAESYCARNSN